MGEIISIYEDIKANFMKMPYYPYLFQDEDAGILEASILIYPNEMNSHKKYEFANTLYMYLQDSVELNKPTKELIEQLESIALLNYAKEFMEIVRFNITKDVNLLKTYLKVGHTLATLVSHKELVKLGILLLGLKESEENTKIIMTLGYHSEYTAYAVEAYRYSVYRNDHVMELLGKTTNYGRICALCNYVVMDCDTAIYLMEHSHNDRLPCYATYVILDKIVCKEYFENINLTKYNFSKYSYLLAHALIDRSLKEFTHVLPLLKKFVVGAQELSSSFIDYCAILVIYESLKNGNMEDRLQQDCLELLCRDEFRILTQNCLESFNGKKELLIQACIFLKIAIPDTTLVKLFKEACVVATEYMFKECEGNYVELAKSTLLPMVMPKIIGNGWRNKLELSREENFVVEFLKSTKGSVIEVVEAAIRADNKVLRNLAMDVLFDLDELPDTLFEVLEECLEKEVESDLKRKYRKLLKLKKG